MGRWVGREGRGGLRNNKKKMKKKRNKFVVQILGIPGKYFPGLNCFVVVGL